MKDMPRAARWLIGLGVGLLAYFLAVEPALDAAAQWSARADSKALALDEHRRGRAQRESAAAAVSAGLATFGPVAMPVEEKRRSEEFNRRVNAILAQHGIRDHTSTSRTAPMPTDALAGVFGAGVRVGRLVTELQFEARPDVVAAVIADLEQSAEVSAITRIDLRKGGRDSSRLLRAQVSAESLVLLRTGGSR